MTASDISYTRLAPPPLPIGLFLSLRGTMPLIDVRSPAEFRQGHIPGAVSLPLLDDTERAVVGSLYKQYGKANAMQYGMKIVEPKQPAMLGEILAACGRYSVQRVAVYCWRGGERSAAVTHWLSHHGLTAHRLDGGYKSFRRTMLSLLEQQWPLCTLAGKTGSGKTEVLHVLHRSGAQTLDLEAMAQHRGSAFGSLPGQEQPSCEQFENRLGSILQSYSPHKPLWVEDESEKLGRVRVPRTFFTQLRTAPAFLLTPPYRQRLNRILHDYACISQEQLRTGIESISKRLGNERFRHCSRLLENGSTRDLAVVLLHYYDKAYTYNKKRRDYRKIIYCRSPYTAAQTLLQSSFPQKDVSSPPLPPT